MRQYCISDGNQERLQHTSNIAILQYCGKVLNLASCFPHPGTVAIVQARTEFVYVCFCFQERSMAGEQTNWMGGKYHQDVENEKMCLTWMKMDIYVCFFLLLNLVYF